MANQHLYCLYKPRLFTLLAQEHSHTHSVGYKEKTWSASWLRHWPVVEAVSLDWPGRGRRFRAKGKGPERDLAPGPGLVAEMERFELSRVD